MESHYFVAGNIYENAPDDRLGKLVGCLNDLVSINDEKLEYKTLIPAIYDHLYTSYNIARDEFTIHIIGMNKI